MLCHLTGALATEPVASKTTGHIYDRKNLENYLSTKGTCPVTGQAMSANDVLSLHLSSSPYTPVSTQGSIPDLLSALSREWDLFLVDHHHIRQELDNCKIELCKTKHQLEASLRVITRLSEGQIEGEIATGLSTLDQSTASSETTRNVEELNTFVRNIDERFSTLSAARRTRPIRKPALSLLRNFSNVTKVKVGEAAIAAVLPIGSDGVFSGSCDGIITVSYVNEKEELIQKTQFSSLVTSLNCVAHYPIPGSDTFATAGSGGPVCLWDLSVMRADNKMDPVRQFTISKEPVTGLVLCPSAHGYGTVVLTSDATGFVAATQIETQETFIRFPVVENPSKVSLCAHPDGVVLGVVPDSPVAQLYDLRLLGKGGSKNALIGKLGNDSSASNLAALTFSQNGYQAATAARSGDVMLWDLRRTPTSVTCNTTVPSVPSSLSFDSSGLFLAIGTEEQSYLVAAKTMEENILLSDSNGTTTLRFSDAEDMISKVGNNHTKLKLYSGSKNGSVRVHSLLPVH